MLGCCLLVAQSSSVPESKASLCRHGAVLQSGAAAVLYDKQACKSMTVLMLGCCLHVLHSSNVPQSMASVLRHGAVLQW